MINFKQYLENNSLFLEAVSIIKQNSKGKIYLVGGYVYRYFINGNNESTKDIDFLIDKLTDNIELPSGWEIQNNKFGHPRFINKNKKIDPIQLSKHIYIVYNNLKPTLENYLNAVPLNIQSIAYDIDDDNIIGKIGLDAIKNKIIKLNNQEHAITSCKYYHNISVNQMIILTANSLGFNYELINKDILT